ncbi:hypothetical protein ACQ3HE_15190 [Plantibacter auratus]|uniref:hypothetical protein n=1 Tax=Plantibacter auratus TaxID=272914 RepID=UPI003D329591
MPKPITLLDDRDRELATHLRAVLIVSDGMTESWDLEVLADGPDVILAADSYSFHPPSEKGQLQALLSHVLSSVGLQTSPSWVADASVSPTDFTLSVSKLEK